MFEKIVGIETKIYMDYLISRRAVGNRKIKPVNLLEDRFLS